MCCSCGHCAAICPENAISATQGKLNAFKILQNEEQHTEIEKLLIGKRSVRHFKKDAIEKDVLENFIHYAEKSPSSSNKRKREYIIIRDEKKIIELEKAILRKFNSLKFIINPITIGLISVFSRKLSLNLKFLLNALAQMNAEFTKKEYPIFRGAPLVVCVIAPKRAQQSKDDCIIAQQYMMLYAESIGIGSCIIGYAQYAHKTLEKRLKVKKGYSVYAVSVFGFPKFIYEKEIQYTKTIEVKWM